MRRYILILLLCVGLLYGDDFSSDLLPDTASFLDLGSAVLPWQTVYADTFTDGVFSVNGGIITGATWNGVPIDISDFTTLTVTSPITLTDDDIGLNQSAVDHALLDNLAWDLSGHTGTASNFAGFSGTGAYAFYPESDYILVDGTRALTGNWDAGAFDIRALTGTFDSLTSGRVPFASTNGLLIDDSDLTFATDTLTATKIGAFTLTGKLTAGATEIEGSAFDINGGTVDAITSLTVANSVDIGNFTLTANGLTIDGTFTDGTASISGGNMTVQDVISHADSDVLIRMDAGSNQLQIHTHATGDHIILLGGNAAADSLFPKFYPSTTDRGSLGISSLRWGEIWGTDVHVGGTLTFNGPNPDIIGNDTDGVLSITADTATNQGGHIKLYGNTHASKAQDIELYADATLVLSWDESEGNWDFDDENVKGVGALGCGTITVAEGDDITLSGDGIVTSGSGGFVVGNLTITDGSIDDTDATIAFGDTAFTGVGAIGCDAITATAGGLFTGSTFANPGIHITTTSGNQAHLHIDGSAAGSGLTWLLLTAEDPSDAAIYFKEHGGELGAGWLYSGTGNTLTLRAWEDDGATAKAVMTLTQAADASGDVASIVWAGTHLFSDSVEFDGTTQMDGAATFNSTSAINDEMTVNDNVSVFFGADTDVSVQYVDGDEIFSITDGTGNTNSACFQDFAEVRIGDDSLTNHTAFANNGSPSFVGTARIDWTKITANNMTQNVNNGNEVGDVTHIQVARDGNVYQMPELGAAPAIDIEVEFVSVTAFNWVNILAMYDGATTHDLTVQLYNFDEAQWETFSGMASMNYTNTTTMRNYDFFVPDDTAFIGTAGDVGDVRVRFVHVANGSANHDLYIDVVALYQ